MSVGRGLTINRNKIHGHFSRLSQPITLGARDFSSAVSGFCQVFIVTRAKSFSRGFGLRPKMCRPSANTENFRHTREKPLVPRVAAYSRRYQKLERKFHLTLKTKKSMATCSSTFLSSPKIKRQIRKICSITSVYLGNL